MLDSGDEGPGFKSQPRRCRVYITLDHLDGCLLLSSGEYDGITDKHRPRYSVCSIRPHPRYFAVRPGNSCQSTRRRPATEAATSDRQTASLVRNSHHHINVTRSMPLSPVPCLSLPASRPSPGRVATMSWFITRATLCYCGC